MGVNCPCLTSHIRASWSKCVFFVCIISHGVHPNKKTSFRGFDTMHAAENGLVQTLEQTPRKEYNEREKKRMRNHTWELKSAIK